MKILCGFSGVEFSVDHFPFGLYARESYHPVFDIPQRKLFTLLPKWAAGELTPVDSYLMFLSLLRSSDLVDFRVPARITQITHSLVAQNMEHLAKTLSRINTISHPSATFTHYVVSPETCDLANVSFWLDNWKANYDEFLAGARRNSPHDLSKINRREAALERLIKSPHKDIKEVAPAIAEWAALAGDFPTGLIPDLFTGLQTPLSEYWKKIIVKCAHRINLFSIPKADIEELLEHCESNIPYGSIFSSNLFKILRGAIEAQRNFLSVGDMDVSGTRFTLLESGSSAETANIQAMIQNAPSAEPKKEDYPDKFSFMKATMRWNMARKSGNQS